jgi:fructokinase
MKARPVVVGLGEVLWDLFDDGPRFGGAPANFACSVAELGRNQFEVVLASAVGNDELGDLAFAALADHQVNSEFVARLNYPTGKVDVTLDEYGHASYAFASNTAWDHLIWNQQLETLANRANVVCFGTLAQRSDKSQKTIQHFVANTPASCLRMLDINLRDPYWNQDVILQSLAIANALKLNDSELCAMTSLLQLKGSDEAKLEQIMKRFSLRVIALTRGSKGSLLLLDSGERSDLAAHSVEVVDTVGVGDAFTATLALGLLKELPLETVHRWANEVAAFVCTQSGATPRLRSNLCLPDESNSSANT